MCIYYHTSTYTYAYIRTSMYIYIYIQNNNDKRGKNRNKVVIYGKYWKERRETRNVAIILSYNYYNLKKYQNVVNYEALKTL